MTTSIKFAVGLGLAVLLIGTAVYFKQQNSGASDSITSPGLEARLTAPRPLTAFQLTAHDLQPLDLSRLKGKWTLLFFGYTHCPDICPITLTELAQTAQQLEPAILKNTQFVFVSVDPQRDRPESLAEYIGYFNEHFIGATGSNADLTTFAQQLDSKFSLETNPAGEPIVNHSSAMLLIDPQVRYYARLKAPHYAEEVRAQYLALRHDYTAANP